MARRQPERAESDEEVEAPATYRVTIAVNVGGCVIPVAFSIYLLAQGGLRAGDALAAVASVALVAYWFSRPLRGIGVVMPFLIAPLAAVLVASALDYEQRAPLAYIGATLGVLLGADLFRLRDIRRLGAPVASIGGAGTFDGVFISGLLAVLFA
jgi:uncharacterized membrane protein